MIPPKPKRMNGFHAFFFVKSLRLFFFCHFSHFHSSLVGHVETLPPFRRGFQVSKVPSFLYKIVQYPAPTLYTFRHPGQVPNLQQSEARLGAVPWCLGSKKSDNAATCRKKCPRRKQDNRLTLVAGLGNPTPPSRFARLGTPRSNMR